MTADHRTRDMITTCYHCEYMQSTLELLPNILEMFSNEFSRCPPLARIETPLGDAVFELSCRRLTDSESTFRYFSAFLTGNSRQTESKQNLLG